MSASNCRNFSGGVFLLVMTNSENKDIDFIKRLTNIVNNNLGDDSFGVTDLSNKIGISHSQIHRRLKGIKDQSISQFIKELRLMKAQELLKQTGLTVSEVAYQVGFSSPSYFNKCYHDFFGYPPGEYKNHIKIESAEIKDGPISKELVVVEKKFYKLNHLLWMASLVVLMILTAYLFTKKRTAVSAKYGNSVVILPLKNLNANSADQYLANGIMSDLQNRLSHVKGLVVKSNINSEKIKVESNTIPQIAKEFKVSYILEGSMMKQDDRIRIYIHLIDAKANVVWSDQYDHNLSSIFDFVSDASKQIVQNLQTPLQYESIQQLDKQYTYNEKAYLLYLEGRFYYRLRTKDGFIKSIELYNQALQVDSNYALAYAGLADSYLTGTWNGFYSVDDGIQKCKMYLNKAQSLDQYLAEAHTTYGGLATYFDSDYKEAEKHLKLALKLNPGYDRANKIYAEFCDVTGKNEEARKYINKAHFLNPTYPEILYLSYLFYCHNGDCKNALKESLRMFNLNKNERQYLESCFNIYLQQHDDSLAYVTYKKINHLKGDLYSSNNLDSVYTHSKIKGILQLIIKSINKEEKDSLSIGNELRLANYYTLLGDKEQAVEYLEKSFNKNPGPVHRVGNNVAFQSLHNEPKYKALMRKMNLNH
ncbi:helix-turn-helix domain-containing protein [Plebeiibacterium sediminum]|uniref:Helix-turn-helix domain-containing protein n=1 Tax=Plebeiibacterium sediminum TaxID=2992112 RepID=A0AAE3M5Y1_9BACT|nr:helix-turn-helix domain-containing protein [Plebeiobacterium sediminum]MCW3787551.1 helix-turn-helix domain-containing protein [Plebeiobacterium sediminum]